MKKFLAVLLLASSLFAQYTKNDLKLVKTTATREFDRKTILDYLQSNKSQKIIAGLLSVSHSLDTSFVENIVKIDFDEYSVYVCFALGQIGNSYKSSDYLYKELIGKNAGKYSHELYDALGKIADENLAQKILNLASETKKFPRDGISIFIFNLFSRKVSFDKATVKQILLSEIRNNDAGRRLEALFSIARLGGMKEAEKDLISIITSKDKFNSAQVKSFAIGCFTRQKYFPNNKKLLAQIYSNKDWRVRTEAAKALSFFNFTAKTQLKNYFKLVTDTNVNVSRQAAISIRNIKPSKTLAAYLNGLIEPCFVNSKLNSVSKGELFISYCTMNPSRIMASIKKYDKPIADKYVFEVLNNPAVPAKDAYSYLAKKMNKKEKEILDLAPTFLNLQGKLDNNNAYNSQLLELLDSKFSSVSSTIADGIDSIFAAKHFEQVKGIVIEQAKTHINDARYYETLVSMFNLGERINKELKSEMMDIYKHSRLFTIQQFINQKSGNEIRAQKEFSNFEVLWKNAFTYSKAIVKTEKGEFTIKFHPEYAPISVGNFVSLSKKGFYDGVAFHRVVPNFVAQTGDSTGTGFGGPGYDIVSEFSPLPFNTNYVGMASAGRDTEGSQWYVMHNVALHLYGKYSTFGKVVNGTRVIPRINQGDKIISIQLVK